MDHENALRLGAVEKYLLNELPPDQRDEFEEHFFDCQICAVDLRAGAVFLDAAKEQLRYSRAPQPVPQRRSRFSFLWTPSFAVPAFAAMLIVIGYENFVTLPRMAHNVSALSAPEVLPAISLALAESRGGSLPVASSPGGKPFLLLFDIPGDSSFTNYTCFLYAPSGSLIWQVNVPASQARDTVSLRVPSPSAGEGIYRLRVQGNSPGSQKDLAQYRFTLKTPVN